MNSEIGSYYNININTNTHIKRLLSTDTDVKFYTSGRVALKDILSKLNKINKCNIELIIPNYICESLYDVFKLYNTKTYEIDNSLNLNINSIEKYLKENNEIQRILYVIYYFGYIDTHMSKIKKLCNENNIIIIDDFTHNMYIKDDELYGDISLCSFRKSLPTPFGSILKINNKMILTKLENITCERLNKSEFTEFFKYLFVNFIRLTGMCLKNFNYIKPIWRQLLTYSELYIDKINYKNHDIINNMFYKLSNDYRYKAKRMKNFEYLNNNIKIKTFDKFKNTYFTYPIMFENKTERDHYKNELIKNQIYCVIYWPQSFNKTYVENKFIEKHILCIPIDQRYTIKDMERIVTIFNNI